MEVQVFHNMFIFSTIKSHLKLSSVCSHVVFPSGWSSDGRLPGGGRRMWGGGHLER